MIAVYAGSFSPPTKGHLDIIRRSAAMFDQVVVAVLSQEAKRYLFSPEERREMLLEITKEFDNVRVIDSMNLSTGQGLVVLKACELAKQCETADQIEEALNAFTSRVEASFLLDQLQYMVKGGRCSSAAALGANLLNLKPCIEVRDGKMSVVKKYRGNYAKCLATYIKDRLADREDIDKDILFSTYTSLTEPCKAAVDEALDSYSNFDNIYWATAGCTVTCHCGPSTYGVLFVRK